MATPLSLPRREEPVATLLKTSVYAGIARRIPPVRTEGERATPCDEAEEGGRDNDNKSLPRRPERSPESIPHAAENQGICVKEISKITPRRKTRDKMYQQKHEEHYEKFDHNQTEATAELPIHRSSPHQQKSPSAEEAKSGDALEKSQKAQKIIHTQTTMKKEIKPKTHWAKDSTFPSEPHWDQLQRSSPPEQKSSTETTHALFTLPLRY